jgi:hypothetical protein
MVLSHPIQNSVFKINIIILLLLGLLLCLTFNNYNDFEILENEINRKLKMDIKKNYDKCFAKYRVEYPCLSEHFWLNIESLFNNTMKSDNGPSVISLAYKENESKSLNVFLTFFTECYLNVVDLKTSKNLKNSSISKLNISPNRDKKLSRLIEQGNFSLNSNYIIDQLHKIFSKGNKFAIVKNIEKMPFMALINFYDFKNQYEKSYGNNIIFILTIELTHIIDDSLKNDFYSNHSELEVFVRHHLVESWTNILGLPLFYSQNYFNKIKSFLSITSKSVFFADC